jgi:hypothetical protein
MKLDVAISIRMPIDKKSLFPAVGEKNGRSLERDESGGHGS